MSMAKRWQKKEVRQVGEVVTGTTPSTKKPEYYGDEFKLISPADLDSGKYVTTAHRTLSALGLEQCRVLSSDAVLVGCIGNVGKIGMVADEKAATNQQINAVICNTEHHPHFIYYSLHYNRQRLEKAAVKTTVPILNKSNFERFVLDVPPLPEQRRIAHVLSTVQTAIEQQARLIALTRELKAALMRKLFTEGLHGEKQKETEIGLVPESWEAVKISSLGKCVTGTTPKTSVEEYYTPAEYDFIAPADLGITRDVYSSGKKISAKGIEVIRSLPKSAVMCVCIGSSIGKVGMTWNDVSATNQQVNSIICDSNYNPQFIYYLLFYYSEYWRRFATFGTVPILNKNRFEGIEIPVTKKRKEQDDIANILSSVDTKIENNTQKRVLLEELFRTLLHQLMTGQVRVKDSDFSKNLRGEQQ